MIEERSLFDKSRTPIEAGQHICAMYFGVRERDDVLLPFLVDGLNRGDKCFAGIQEREATGLLAKLAATVGSDADVPKSVAREQLEVKTSDDHILSPDLFDPDEIVGFWDTTVSAALTGGFDFVRLTAEASWWMAQLPGWDAMFRYESELNRYAARHPQAILCMYDLSQYTEGIVINLLKTHPLVLLSGMPIENPYYVPPDELLA
jgi:hypothetical protein